MASAADPFWLDDNAACSPERLAELSGLSLAEIQELVDSGVLTPVEGEASVPAYRLTYVMTVRTARRLRDDFELDSRGVTLALALLRRIDELEAELAAQKARRR
jgi:chaperone modulatory protein CbpM